jgi:ribose-phosphate pyrophosphokinase
MKTYLSNNYGIDTTIAITEKIRGKGGRPEIMFVVGEVEDKNVVLIDDMIDSAGTLCEGADTLRKKGTKEMVACCSHGLFSMKEDKRAEDRLRESEIRVISTDTIPRSSRYLEENKDWLDTVSVTPRIANAIYRLNEGMSFSDLYPSGI